MPQQQLLLVLGGHYHDFAGFESFIREALDGFEVRATYDTADLLSLGAYDVVVLYTCYVEPPQDPEDAPQYTAGISDDQIQSLVQWVRAAGGLVAAHSATTIRPENQELQRLIGGRFVSHPPRFPFTVYPMDRRHPITQDVGPFTVVDELYTQEYADVDVHAVAVDRGAAHPMVWTRAEGQGRVVHLAPGHDAAVWRNDAYRKLMRQAVNWAAGVPSPIAQRGSAHA